MYTVIAPIPNDLATALQPLRKRYDPLADALPPHISLLSPFDFSGSLPTLLTHLKHIGETHSPIKVSFVGWDTYAHIDYQLRVPVIAGKEKLIRLREDLLTGPLEFCPGQDKDYWPHVVIGKFTSESEFEKAKQNLQGFEPQFIFRVAQMQLLQWKEAGHPWELTGQFGLEATLANVSRAR